MMNYFAENNRGDGMDQKELTQVTCVIHGGRSLPVYWKRGKYIGICLNMLSVPNMDQFTEDKWRVMPSGKLETVGIIHSKVITFRSSEGSSTVYAMAGREQVFTCETCKRSFGYKHVLQNHERTHTGEKPFHCGLCEKKFTRDHHLKMHMRLHLGQKPYECTECDRKFVQVANLRRHLRVHTGERPYPCELCKSKFSDSNQLKSHMLIHKGEKPFKCIWCQRRFRRRQQLLHHKCSSKKDK